ncbi:MAG TPA: hypothetical protein VMS30_04750 [Phycisphaerales bacterium]|nr:hypothetical protein [Phycisphaerales bacterium]
MKLLALISLSAATVVLGAPVTAAPMTSLSPTLRQDDVQEMARGAVKSFDGAKKTFTINSGAEGAKDVVITWNDTTVFMLDGKVAKWDEVVKNSANLVVTHKKGVASKVEGIKK